ncbi:hypothetical protein Moror_9929 [Moniliophthora roreri MCA 2997]|uniref:Uncharacterized protein n=1 Tax=Moniliophthora roreri (strain MCA 2997) TaxID=1381753 RepID=V2WZS3_MONRO|nr:hypothetical protein Moror_9929 [Moniliophthora roreri MCA 2997]
MLMGEDEKPNGRLSSKTVKAWKSRRDATMEMLVKCLEDEVLTHAKGFDEDPAGLWAHLTAIFRRSGVGAAVRMWREFSNVKYRGEEMTIVMGRIQSLADDLKRIHNDQPSDTQIVAVMLNSIAEYSSFSDLITNLESLKEELEVDDVELRIIWKVKNLKDDGRLESGGVPMIAKGEVVALAANSKVIQCKNPKCQRMGHTIEECSREGGKKEGQYPEWYLRLRRNDGSMTQITPTSSFTNHYAM